MDQKKDLQSQTLDHTFSHVNATGNAIKLKANMMTKPPILQQALQHI